MYNPDKKLKATKKASHTVKVVLIEDGKSATVIQHIVGIQTGMKENVRKGLGVRKQRDARSSLNPPLVERPLNVDIGFHEAQLLS
ncbi:hypothetical protein V6N13_015988 [Hibiscus sabdariffa]